MYNRLPSICRDRSFSTGSLFDRTKPIYSGEHIIDSKNIGSGKHGQHLITLKRIPAKRWSNSFGKVKIKSWFAILRKNRFNFLKV